MKKFQAILVVALVSMFAVGTAYGHQGEMKFMFQFPDHLVPELDGDMSDWDIVSDVYKIQGENMFNQFGAPMDLADFNASLIWAYNVSENKAYFSAWLADDAINETEKWSDEGLGSLRRDLPWFRPGRRFRDPLGQRSGPALRSGRTDL